MNISKYKKRAKCNICGKVRYTDKLITFNGHSYCKVTNSIAAIPNTIYIPLYVDGKKQSSIGITKCQKELIRLLKNKASNNVDLHNNLIDDLFWIHAEKTNLKLTLKSL